MLFNTWTFAAFLVALFPLYHFIPGPKEQRMVWQVGLLIVASYVFYAWHTPWLVIILAASTWINAYVTLKLVNRQTPVSKRKRWVTFAILANLGVLVFFKYASLLVKSLLPGAWWSHWGFDLTQIPLPVGISFFTFQGISLVVDIYRSKGEGMAGLRPPESRAESRWLMVRMAFFKAFFPQLVAGPIVKAHEFMHQIAGKTLRHVDWDDAIKKLILGYFFKMVVADNLKEVTASLSYPAFVGMPGINLLFLLYGFSFQIFADFFGYSLIAMGLARLFGYQLPINFNFPYLSQSITEFWRRWHISLSTWLREYLYFPLGGNRLGATRTYINLIVVMLLGGLWHGAAWSYMVWGGAHGLLLAIERFLGVKGEVAQTTRNTPSSAFSTLDPRPSTSFIFKFNISSFILRAFRVLLIFNVVSFLWLLFQLPNFGEVLLYLKELANWHPGFAPQPIFATAFFSLPVLLYHVWGSVGPDLRASLGFRYTALFTLSLNTVYAVLLFLIVSNSGSPGAFIYFQF